MTAPSQPLLTIDELGAHVALALSVDYDGPPNERVRQVPDRRTIRYYTTLGLIDRPAEMRGRTALYARRHLLQLVAIKRLQARGLSLAEIQQRLVGLPDASLSRLARLPDLPALRRPEGLEATPVPGASRKRLENFWRSAPASVRESPGQASVSGAEPDAAPGVLRAAAEPDAADSARPAVAALYGVPLADDAILMLVPYRSLDDEDISALRVAAAPLLKLLETRRLLRPRHERGTS
jgi:DNA-binding transcriptional MerR regulator